MIRRIALLGVLFGLGLQTSLWGDVINVPGDQPSIQAAIDAAADGDEILVAPGTYFETIDLLGKGVRLRSSAGRDVTTIDAGGSGRVIVGAISTTVIDGFTVTGGIAEGAFPDNYGGGMFITFSSPTVMNCTFIENTAEFGGGIGIWAVSRPTLINCIFSGNTAQQGGGLFVGTGLGAVVIRCTFSGNTAERGGGINIGLGNTMVTHCVFNGNQAAHIGGGIAGSYSTATVTNCTFTGNTAGTFGGGMFVISSGTTVTNCTFSGNTAESGGGMCNISGGSPTITNCTFSGNSATDSGGGMANFYHSSPMVTNCTFSGNDAENGKALAFDSSQQQSPSELSMTNCILWDGGDEVWNNDNSVIEIAYSNVQGGWPGEGNIDADPLFVDADGPDDIPGTADENLRLSLGSPAIDAADNTAVPADTQDLDGDGDTDEPLPFDLDGNPRFVDDPDTPDTGNPDGTNPIVDMGAYEFGPPDPCADEDGDGQVTICHIPPGNPDNAHTITVGVNAVPAHLAHGDHCGACEEHHGLLMGGSSDVIAGPCPTDLDDSGDIGAVDLALLLGSWGPCAGCPADFNGDGVVGPLDLALLLGAWGPCAA